MPNEQLVAYIRGEFVRGVDRATVIRSLLTSGWKVEDINAAMAVVSPVPNQNMSAVPQPAYTAATAGIPSTVKYAGFWVRAAAIIVDGLFLGALQFVVFFIFGSSFLVSFVATVISWGYAVLMITAYQATLGKMAVGLRVERTSGEKISFLRVALREIPGKFVSGITLGVGFFMIGWTQKKQGLHDKIADTVVVEKDPNKSKTVWIVIAVIMTLALPIIGIFAAITLSSLNAARIKGADAAVRADMSTVAVQAELYYGTYGNGNGYLGYCTSPEALSVLADASRSGSTDGSDTFYMCSDSEEEYAASAPLKSGGYVCVDSMGASASTVIEQFLPIGTYVCPSSVSNATASTVPKGNVLSGSDRNDFVQGSTNSCIEESIKSPSYDGISYSSIASYCSCVSSKIADETTSAELKEIANLSGDMPLPPYMQERVDASYEVCGDLLIQ